MNVRITCSREQQDFITQQHICTVVTWQIFMPTNLINRVKERKNSFGLGIFGIDFDVLAQKLGSGVITVLHIPC